jgi:hypothetical protein
MGERESPLGINATVGAVVVVGCCVVPPGLTGPEIDARLGVLAVGLAAFAAAVVDVAAVAVSVGVGSGSSTVSSRATMVISSGTAGRTSCGSASSAWEASSVW